MARRRMMTRKEEKAMGSVIGMLLKAALFVLFLPVTLPYWIYITFFRADPKCDMCGGNFNKADSRYSWTQEDGSTQKVCAHCNSLMRKKHSATAVKARMG